MLSLGKLYILVLFLYIFQCKLSGFFQLTIMFSHLFFFLKFNHRGGLESLFEFKKDHTIKIPSKDENDKEATIQTLIQILKRQIKPDNQDKFSKLTYS